MSSIKGVDTIVKRLEEGRQKQEQQKLIHMRNPKLANKNTSEVGWSSTIAPVHKTKSSFQSTQKVPKVTPKHTVTQTRRTKVVGFFDKDKNSFKQHDDGEMNLTQPATTEAEDPTLTSPTKPGLIQESLTESLGEDSVPKERKSRKNRKKSISKSPLSEKIVEENQEQNNQTVELASSDNKLRQNIESSPGAANSNSNVSL